MTRNEVTQEILSIKSHNLLLEIPTGFGKSKIALDIIKQTYNPKSSFKILIVVPKNVLKENWKDEFTKWDMTTHYPKVTFTTYVSLPKYAGKWDMVIWDECHHITERCKEALSSFTINRNILLSATVKRTTKQDFKSVFSNLYTYKINIREAIDNEVLPDPKVILYPLTLDDSQYTEIVTDKKTKNTLYLTQRGYYNNISRLIDWYKKKALGGNQALKRIWLHKAGERLKWLSSKKTKVVTNILEKLEDYRTLTFCSSIKQAELLGKYHIHSQNKNSEKTLTQFNNGKINHITCVAILDEGVNLTNCQIGIYANLNSSQRIVKQRLGRILRHKNPIIIIPFYLHTRDEEIVKEMLEDYNPKLVSVAHNIHSIKI